METGKVEYAPDYKSEPASTQPKTPWLYEGRVGHDVSEGFCSCGGFHRPEDVIRVGTKTVSVQVDGENKTIEWTEPNQEPRGFTEEEWREITTQNERWAKHQLLKDAALEAAKAERVAAKEYEAHLISKNWHRSVETRVAREKAVDALIAFEAEHANSTQPATTRPAAGG